MREFRRHICRYFTCLMKRRPFPDIARLMPNIERALLNITGLMPNITEPLLRCCRKAISQKNTAEAECFLLSLAIRLLLKIFCEKKPCPIAAMSLTNRNRRRR